MPALPLELIRHVVEDIIDDVDDPIYYRHLSVVSLSCRLLRHEAQRLLFRDSGELYTSSTSRKETTLFLDTVISSPERLALFVNTLSINFNDFFSPDSDETTALVQKLSRALQIMRNLQSLDVSEQIVGICSLPNILHDVHFKLTSFCWSGYGADTELEGADIKANFLRCQDRVEHLQLSGFIEESTLKPIAIDICPRLQSLAATYSITELILPKKEFITSLRWISPVGEHTIVMDNPFHLDLISEPLGRVRYLSYDDINDVLPVGPKIQHIAPYLTSLVCLDTNRGDLRVRAMSYLVYTEKLTKIHEEGGSAFTASLPQNSYFE